MQYLYIKKIKRADAVQTTDPSGRLRARSDRVYHNNGFFFMPKHIYIIIFLTYCLVKNSHFSGNKKYTLSYKRSVLFLLI